jgi:fibronectin-binding autotransporter adhesin
MNTSLRSLRWVLHTIAIFAGFSASVHAADLYWDTNGGNNTGSGSNSTGTWGSSNFWNTDAAGDAGTFTINTTADDDLFFVAGPSATSGNGAYTVTVSGTQLADSLTIQASGNTTLSGGNLTLGNGTDGSGGITLAQFAYGSTNTGAVSISTAIALNNSQSWTNNSANSLTTSGNVSIGNYTLTLAGPGSFTMSSTVIDGVGGSVVKEGSGTLTLGGSNNTFSGGFTLRNGTVIYSASTPTTVFGTGTLTLEGGILRTNDITTRSVANALAITGPVTFGATGTNGNQNFISATQSISNNATLTFETKTANFSTGLMVLNSNATFLSGNGGIGQFNGGFDLNGSNRTLTINTGTAMEIRGTLADTVSSGTKLVLSGNGLATVGTLNSGANSPAIEVNSNTGGVFTFNGNGTYNGTTTLTNGTIVVAANSVGGAPPTSGPFGTGTVFLNGGTVRATSTQSFANNVVIGGAVRLDAAGNPTNNSLNLTGAVTLNSGAAVTYTSAVAASTHTISGLVTLNASQTVSLNSTAGTGTFATWSGGIDLNNGNRTLTVGGNAVRTLAIGGTLKDTGGSGHNLTIDGANTVLASAAITSGTGNPGIIYNGTGTFDASTQQSTWAGGFTLNSGIASISASSTVTNGTLVSGPFGTGTLTLKGGWLSETSTSQTLHNSLVVSGNVIIASAANPGNQITFNPTTSNGTITFDGAVTIQSNHGAAGATFTGPITGINSPSLTIKGFNNGTGAALGAVTLTNAGAVASSFGNVTVGDGAASGSAGGLLITGTQNATGSGVYTIAYGGRWNNGFASNNVVNVNNGGTLSLNGTPVTSLITFASGSTLTSAGTVGLTNGTTVALPTAGALFNTSPNAVTITGAYPAFTGTLAFGGTGSNSITTTANTTTGGAQTLAFNQFGGGGMNFNGLVLGGNLTVAGSGGNGTGLIPASAAGNLGTVTETGGNRVLRIAMAPTGLVSINSAASGWSGGTVIEGGVLATGHNNGVNNLSTGGVTLDGGTWRTTRGTNGGTTSNDGITVGSLGGTLEAYSVGNLPVMTHGGNVVEGAGGAGVLTLRYGGVGTNTSVIGLSGNNSAFDGGYRVTTINGRGRALFSGNASTGGASNVITVESGAAFGFDAFATLNATVGKFVTTTESILTLEGLGASAVDLRNATGGLNLDVRIGNAGSTAYSGTLTPYGSAYRFTPGSTLTLNASNQLTGVKDVDVRAGAIAPGAYGVATGTLAITSSNDFSGNLTVAGTVNNALIGTGTTGTTVEIGAGGNLTSVASVVVEKGATLLLNGTAASPGQISSANAAITARGGGTVRIGNTTAASNNGVTDRVAPTATLTLGGGGLGGGALTMAYSNATVSQTLSKLTVGAGASTINTTNTSNGTMSLAFTGSNGTGYTRSAGGVVNLTTGGNFNVSFTNAPDATNSTVSGSGGTEILVGAFRNGTDFVAATAGNATAPTYAVPSVALFTTLADDNINLTSWSTTGNVTVSNSTVTNVLSNASVAVGSYIDSPSFGAGKIVTSITGNGPYTLGLNNNNNITTANGTTLNFGAYGTLSANTTINSLRAASGNARLTSVLNLAPGATLSIRSGMILLAPNSPLIIQGNGSLTSLTNELLVHDNGNSTTLSAAIAQNGGSNVALTKSGSGTLTLSNSTNAVGDVYALGGTLLISTAGALPTAGNRTLYLQGGTITLSAGGNFSSGTGIQTGSVGGTLNVNAGSPVSFAGDVTLNGALGIGSPGGGGATTTTFSGNLTGAGMLGVGKQADGQNHIVISGNNSGWSGGVLFSQSFANAASGATHLRFAPSAAGYNSSGTGPIVLASGNTPGGIYFDTTAAGSTSFGNDIVNNFTVAPIVAVGLSNGLGTGNANTTTLSGNLVGSQGLFLQGYATGDNAISEMVLSGTVSVSGAAAGYSYGNATFAQNFNNGQGGVTLGVTGNRGVTLQGTGNLPLPQLPSGNATNGAEGFVRFDGAQSFIPGAVGPGYLAALRKGGTGQDGRFGYLLTGSANGTAYALPEGKSFVIGSLGGGTQQYGTLGMSGTGNNTATLLGSAKLAGFESGDVNIHANAAGDDQRLNLFARAAGDTFNVGNATQAVVFTPTYGDSGITSSVTLMANRTGNTTLIKTGNGTVNIANTAYTSVGGAANSARGSFKWELNGGRLNWNQNDGAGANFARVDVNAGATLGGNGVLNSPVFNNANGTVSPGMSFGNLTIGNYTQAANGALTIEIGARPLVDPTLWDHLFVAGNAILDGVLNIIYNAANNFTGVVGDVWKFLANTTGTRTGNFATTNISATGLAPNTALQVNYLSDGVELQLVSTGNNSTVTYDTWKLAYWPSPDANDDWNDDADLDGNINLVEYALDTDPLTPDLLPVTVGESGGNLTLSYDRPGGANYRSDLVYVTQRTTDLSGTSTLNTDTPTGSDADPTSVSVPSTSAYGSVDREFLDLRIEFTAAPAP